MSSRTEWVKPDEVLHTGRYLVARTDNPGANPVFIEIFERRGKIVVYDAQDKEYSLIKDYDRAFRFMFIPEVDDVE